MTDPTPAAGGAGPLGTHTEGAQAGDEAGDEPNASDEPVAEEEIEQENDLA